MALTSASTVDDALAQYNNNLVWDNDSTKASNALEAIRFLLVNREMSIGTEGRQVNYASLETEKAKLEAYLTTVSRAASTNRASFVRAKMIL